jgi:hypothetical protein
VIPYGISGGGGPEEFDDASEDNHNLTAIVRTHYASGSLAVMPFRVGIFGAMGTGVESALSPRM